MDHIRTDDVKNIVDFIKIHTYINGDEPITNEILNNYENGYVFDTFKEMYGGECAAKIDDIRIMYVDYMEGGGKMGKKIKNIKGNVKGDVKKIKGDAKKVKENIGKAKDFTKKKSKKEMCKMCEKLNCP